ncbi:MBL fold metallo-hydrolase [Streptomyces sp. DH37]|uniref:MBL fold metallo-hydrolase n=1 Tax=Streptomyces sp. DH37 TaxID=3040122 RepID=UPI00244236B0|nr:MBL fold metallo-hydrolase [Streptomyces sp. DH37]MDG9700958.1 MBL fold metallo-hydrolase [Streptomyces sp. DH37]
MTVSAPGRDERLRRPSGLRSLRLGELRVTYVPDGAAQLVPHLWLPGTTGEVWAEHPEYLDESGHLVASIGGLLVEHGERALLIDTGFGPHSVPAQPGSPLGAVRSGALPAGLARAGRRPEDIEAVAVTHLHIDHGGWAWHPDPAEGRFLFAHADHLLTRPEWEQRHLAEASGITREMLAAIDPRVRTVEDGEEVFPGVRVEYAAGHTVGHAVYVISSGGRRLIAFGDAMHSPLQADHPEWPALPDHDPERAAAFRRRLLDELEEPGTIGFGGHFADVVFGRVRRGGPGPAWQPYEG